jgi:Raf kinase inhibitor-like YbhB/YbcL family protein
MKGIVRFALLCCALVLAACQGGSAATPVPAGGSGAKPATIALTSSAFKDGEAIPRQYSCDGANVSVPLAWGDVPTSAQSLALIMDDPDAPSGMFVHWVLYNLPAQTRSLPEGTPADATLSNGGRNGVNGARRSGYTGPCPPSGTHHYHFKLYALDTTLTLNPGATKEQLLTAMNGHVLGQGELVGTYQR